MIPRMTLNFLKLGSIIGELAFDKTIFSHKIEAPFIGYFSLQLSCTREGLGSCIPEKNYSPVLQ